MALKDLAIKLSQKNLTNCQRASTHNGSKILNGSKNVKPSNKWHLTIKQAITQRDIQGTSLDLLQERKVPYRHACKSQTVKALDSRVGLSLAIVNHGTRLYFRLKFHFRRGTDKLLP